MGAAAAILLGALACGELSAPDTLQIPSASEPQRAPAAVVVPPPTAGVGASAQEPAPPLVLLPEPELTGDQALLLSELGCPELAQEADVCLVQSEGARLALVGLESGARCALNVPGTEIRGSMGWIGDRVYSCGETSGVIETSLRDGEVRWMDSVNLCRAVTAWGSRLVVYSARARVGDAVILTEDDVSDLRVYASFDALRGEPLAEYPTSLFATRLATSGERLYGAWHSTHQVDVFDLASAQDLRPLELAGYDGSVYGLGVTHAEDLALSVSGRGDANRLWELQVRDPIAGKILRTVPGQPQRGGTIDGMTCGGALSAAPPKAPAPPAPIDPVMVQADCEVSSFDSGSSGAVEVHVVSVYQSVSAPEPSGVVEVLVERPGPVQLVLSASEATEWRVSAGPDTQLVGIAVSGHERQQLVAPAGVPATLEAYEEDGTRRFESANAWNSSAARSLRASVERELGLPMRSFSGCYEGHTFTLR